MTKNTWIKLSILLMGLPILGYIIYAVHQVINSSFMEIANKLAT